MTSATGFDHEPFFRNALNPMIMITPSGVVCDANDACGQAFARQRGEIIGLSYIEFVHPEDKAAAEKAFLALTALGSVIEFECRIMRPDESFRWVSWTAHTYGEFFYVIGRDVTDWVAQRNQLLRESEALSFVVDNAPVVLFVVAKNGDIIQTRGKGLRSIGRSSADYAGKNVFADKRDNPAAVAMIEKTLAGEGGLFDFKVNEVSFETIASPIRDANGEIIGMVALSIDVDEITRAREENARLRVEAAVHEADKKYHETFDKAAIGISHVSSDGRFLRANPELCRITGYYENELSDLTFADITYEDDLARDYEAREAMLAGHTNQYEAEKRYRRKDGSLVWVAVRVSPVYDADGEFKYFIGIAKDLSSRKESDAREQAALAASRLKSEFLATMSHEIRTPLNAIVALTDLILETKLTEEQKDFAATIQDSGRNLRYLIDDILDFSKIEAGRMDFEEVDFTPEDLLRDVVRSQAHAAKAKGLVLQPPPEIHSNIDVVGDPFRLRQILLNLVQNAIKFTERGEVRVGFFATRDGGKHRIRISVLDTGIGIPEDRLDDVFEPFRQADSSTTRLHGGTGLGLAISRQLAQQMGGTLSVASRVGFGSNFVLEFALPTAQKRKKVVAVNPDHRRIIGGRVLVAEDHAINLKVIRTLLEKMGLEVESVANGVHALHALGMKKYDLVILDYHMPVMDGIETAKRVRAHENPKIRAIPIIAMTADVVKRNRERCLEAGMNDFVSKPIDVASLRATIARFFPAVEDFEFPIQRLPFVASPTGRLGPIDVEFLKRLDIFTLPGEPSIAQDLVDLFITRAPEQIESIRAAAKAHDWTTLQNHAHALKSAARNLGAFDLGDQSEMLEDVANAQSMETLLQIMNRVETAFANALKGFGELGSLKSAPINESQISS